MAKQTRSYLKGKLAQSGARPVAQDMSDLIDSFMTSDDPISVEQLPADFPSQVADEVINNETFQQQLAVNKVDNLDNPNSDDVPTTKAVSDALSDTNLYKPITL